MIRIKLINEGRVVKQISSRVHESVVLEQLKKYPGTVDEIVYEGEISEGAEEILRKVAKKVIPAAMAAGVALGGASQAQAQNYFPGTDRSIGQHIADIFSPNYREIQRQREAERNTRQREFDAYHREIERARVQAARDAGRRAAEHMSGREMPSNIKVYDQARISNDGKSIILYDMDHQITRLPRAGTDFVGGDNQRLPHYIHGSQVYYVRHAAVRESIKELTEDPTVGTIPSAGGPAGAKKPVATTGTKPAAGANTNTPANNQAAKTAAGQAAAAGDKEDDKEDLAALRKAGQMLSGIKEVEQVDEISKMSRLEQRIMGETTAVEETIRKLPSGQYRLYSKKAHKNLGTFDSRSAAEKHEREVQYFKHMGEAIEPKLQDILNKYQSSWEDFQQGGDISDNDAFFNELYDYFKDEMPYGVQKARNGDPVIWITDRLDTLMNEAADSDENELSADRNIIIQLRKTVDYDKPTKLRLDDGSTVVVAPLAAAKLLKMFEKLKPKSKLLMQQVLNKQDGLKQLISHLGELGESLKVKQINTQASAIANRIFDQAVADMAEGSLNEFAPGAGGESGKWYTDDQMTDLVGDGWWEDMDISGNIPKGQMIQNAQAWLDDQGYSVHVLNVKLNDDDCDWFIEGNFYNPNFAKKGVAEETKPAAEPDVITMPHTETDFNVYHSAKKDRYTVRGAGQHHDKMPKRWFKHLPNAISFGRATAKNLSTE